MLSEEEEDRPSLSLLDHIGQREEEGFSRWKMGFRRDFEGFFDLGSQMLRGNARSRMPCAALLNCCVHVYSTAPPAMCCCTVMHYDGGLRFSSISPGCNEVGGGSGPPVLPSGVVQEFGPPGWVVPITPMEGSSRGGPGCPRPAGSYWEFSSREMSRSSSSPNSPPIRLGSPTTITSWEAKEKFGLGDAPFLLRPTPPPAA